MKTPPEAGFESLKVANMGIKARFMPRSFVSVHDALGHGFVDRGNGIFISRFGRFFIARFDRLQNFFNRRTNVGTLTGVLPAVTLCLTGSFSS